MAEPLADHEPVPMLEALPPRIADKCRRSDCLFEKATDIPGGYTWLSRTFLPLKGTSSDLRFYLIRSEIRDSWALRQESAAIGCLAASEIRDSWVLRQESAAIGCLAAA